MKGRIARLTAILAAGALLAVALGAQPARAAGGTVRYVKPTAVGTGSCDSWANACELQYALGSSVADDEIWVKKGVYRPAAAGNQATSFIINAGVKVYGGFAGTEDSESARDWKANRTILSGDIDKNDVNTDGNRIAEKWTQIRGSNSYHVVRIIGTTTPVTATTRLDGFTITAGDGVSGGSTYLGGGLQCEGANTGFSCSPTLANLVFSGNRAFAGGALANRGRSGGASSPALVNVTFRGNRADGNGGAVYNDGYAGTSSPVFTDVTFSGNSADGGGGGMYNYSASTGVSSPYLLRVTFDANTAANGGAMYNDGSNGTSSAVLTNVTLRANSAAEGGGIFNSGAYAGISNPALVSVTFNANLASNYGGAMYSYGFGGTSTPILGNVIMWGDSAPVGPEIYNSSASPTIAYSIVQGSGGSGPSWDPLLGFDGLGNLDADPMLNALANNGGLTKTMTLKMGSPAVNAGSNSRCVEYDQRGVYRPQGPLCDIGAVESIEVHHVFKSQGANDGWVLESEESSGVGGSRNATATTFRLGDDDSDRQYRAVLSFNTASIPDAAVLVGGEIGLKRAGLQGEDPFTWPTQELRATIKSGVFGSLPALQNADFQALSGVSADFPFTTLGPVWYVALLGPYSLSLVKKNGVTQFRLWFSVQDNDDLGADYLMFYSGNAAEVERPGLMVTYYTP